MRVLLDTNIIIHREASRVINQDIGFLFRWLDTLHYDKCIHPLTVTELARHVDPTVVRTMNAKLANYHILQTPAPLHANVSAVSTSIDVNQNDIDDSNLLNELYCGRVNLLITEDNKVHRKAVMLGIAEKVFRINSFLQKVTSENPDFVDYSVLSVKREFFGNIDLKDPFFDGFRNDYPGFNNWYNNKAGGNEKAYVCYDSGALKAFLFLKVEDENEDYTNVTPLFEKCKRLKIGTFKVASNGMRIGERFLKIVFDNARQYKVDEIYVTIFDTRPELLSLIHLLEKFGFVFHGEKTSAAGTEKVFVRNFEKTANRRYPKKTFPWLSRESQVYIIPIRPDYHTELFPDSILRTESEAGFIENQPHRNAISKSYISHSHTRNLNPGDILIFYRSGGIYLGVATTIGIVEETINNISSDEELIQLCKKRTVLSDNDLRQYWNRNPRNRPFVINFLYTFSFKRRMTLKEMLDRGILANMDVVKTITPISFDSLRQLVTLSGI